MMKVSYTTPIPNDVRPAMIPDDCDTVPAEPYALYDDGQGGIVRNDIDPDHVRPIQSFTAGEDVFVKSMDPGDVLDDTNESTEAESHIWWRATVIGPV